LNLSNYTFEEINIENHVHKNICQSAAIHFGKKNSKRIAEDIDGETPVKR
jgi:hypothetical protein